MVLFEWAKKKVQTLKQILNKISKKGETFQKNGPFVFCTLLNSFFVSAPD